MLERAKLALRISHDLLNAELTEAIETARAEMVRAGVSEEVAQDDTNNLTAQAILTYIRWQYAGDTKMTEGFFKSWQYQLDNLRKS